MSVTDPALRIAVADDHAVVRRGLCLLLEDEPDMEVVGEAATVAGAEVLVGERHPDVLVLDLNMTDGSSLPAIPRLAERTRVVVLTMQSGSAFGRESMNAGAVGYVLKEDADEELKLAVRAAATGASYLSSALRAERAPPDSSADPDGLTPREIDVLRMIAHGHTNPEIAGGLAISTRTVECHRAHIQQKLSCSSRAGLVRHALRRGLMSR